MQGGWSGATARSAEEVSAALSREFGHSLVDKHREGSATSDGTSCFMPALLLQCMKHPLGDIHAHSAIISYLNRSLYGLMSDTKINWKLVPRLISCNSDMCSTCGMCEVIKSQADVCCDWVDFAMGACRACWLLGTITMRSLRQMRTHQLSKKKRDGQRRQQ